MRKIILTIVCFMLFSITCLSLCACNTQSNKTKYSICNLTETEWIIKELAYDHANGWCGCKKEDLFDCPRFLEYCYSRDYNFLGYTGEDPDFGINFYVAIDKKESVQVASFPVAFRMLNRLETIWVIDKQGNTLYAIVKYGLHYIIYSRYVAEYKNGVQTYTTDLVKNEVSLYEGYSTDFRAYFGKTEDLPEERFNIISTDFTILNVCSRYSKEYKKN